ncbi:MAG: NAD(P)-binding domain-containing protein [Bacteroidales bacterium]|nr:NAD(P)-binding domain-containing protein [Bacteroidales bacterium]
MSKKGMKILVMLFIIIILIAIVVGSNIFVQNQKIKQLDVLVSYGKTDTIITKELISEELESRFGKFVNKERKTVEGKDIEEFLMNKPYVEKAEVYHTLKGVLKIEIKQREPVVRIYTQREKQYYIDKEGKIIEINKDESTDVVVASGYIDMNLSILKKGSIDTVNIKDKKGMEKNLSNLFLIAKRLQNDSILNYQIDQIYLNKNGSFELIPKIGNYVIKIDEGNDLETQLIKLSYLYKDSFTIIGWDNYSVVDLRYRNQVVCTKKSQSGIQDEGNTTTIINKE